MSNDNNFQGNAPRRDRHAIGDFRVHLTADPQQGSTKQPRFSVHYHKNKIALEVRTNVPADMNRREHGIIRAELQPQVFFMFLGLLQKAVDGPVGERPERMVLKRPDFQKRNNGDPVVEARLAFGKTQEGVVFISVLSPDKERPAIQFKFLPDKFVEAVKGDGSPWGDAELSVALANGYLQMWRQLLPFYVYHRYEPEEFKGNGGGNGNNGGGNGGYNNGGGNRDMRTEPRNQDNGQWGTDDFPF